MARKYIEHKSDAHRRPSERMFRRSRAAENRRRKAQKSESRFIQWTVALIMFVVMIVFGATALITGSFAAAAPPAQSSNSENVLTRPLLGDYSPLDIMGLVFVLVAGYAVFRKFRRK